MRVSVCGYIRLPLSSKFMPFCVLFNNIMFVFPKIFIFLCVRMISYHWFCVRMISYHWFPVGQLLNNGLGAYLFLYPYIRYLYFSGVEV